MFGKKNKVKSGAKKMDKVITGLIVGTAVASMLGLSRTNKGKEVTSNVKKNLEKGYSKGKSVFGSALLKIIDFFRRK